MLQRFKCLDLRDFFRLEISFKMLKLRQISNFSQIQKSPNHGGGGGGGSRKLWTFSTFCDIFFFDGSPYLEKVDQRVQYGVFQAMHNSRHCSIPVGERLHPTPSEGYYIKF